MGFIKTKLFGAVAAVAVLLAAAWAIYDAGHDAGAAEQLAECEQRFAEVRAEHEQALTRARNTYEQLRRDAVESERQYWQKQKQSEVRYETIEKEVIRYVQRDDASQCRADDDFMRIWRAANTNGYTAEPSASE